MISFPCSLIFHVCFSHLLDVGNCVDLSAQFQVRLITCHFQLEISSGSKWHPLSPLYLSAPFFLSPLFFFHFFIHIFLFMPATVAHGSSWARSQIRAAAAAYTTATVTLDQSCICSLHCCLQQCWIINSLRKTVNQICILTNTKLDSQFTELQRELLLFVF